MADQVTLDDFLEHAGVKGMKWGQRKSAVQKAAGNTVSSLRSRNKDIKSARTEIKGSKAKLKEAKSALSSAKDEKGKAAAAKAVQKHEKEYLSNPARATAAKMTVGQAAVGTVLAGPVGLAAVAAVTSGRSAIISRKQAKASDG